MQMMLFRERSNPLRAPAANFCGAVDYASVNIGKRFLWANGDTEIYMGKRAELISIRAVNFIIKPTLFCCSEKGGFQFIEGRLLQES